MVFQRKRRNAVSSGYTYIFGDNHREQHMKKHASTILLVFIFFVGLSVLLYPTVSNWWNSRHMTEAIVGYQEAVADTSEEEKQTILTDAEAYNQRLYDAGNSLGHNLDGYASQLNLGGMGIMGYITIQKLGVELPIYHTTNESVLELGVGHLEGTSLPVGGENTHCVLSGHRGLPSAKLFTNLDKMEVGDTFVITVLDRVLTYQVDDISIVLPTQINDLRIEEGKDYCTLMTCTPYGINTHRLLVRGHRIANAESETLHVTSEAQKIEPLLAATVLAVPMFIVLLVWLLISTRKKRK